MSAVEPRNGAAPTPRGLTRDDLMRPREVAQLLDVPVSTVLDWGRRGVLPRVKLGRHVRFIRSEINETIRSAAAAERRRLNA